MNPDWDVVAWDLPHIALCCLWFIMFIISCFVSVFWMSALSLPNLYFSVAVVRLRPTMLNSFVALYHLGGSKQNRCRKMVPKNGKERAVPNRAICAIHGVAIGADRSGAARSSDSSRGLTVCQVRVFGTSKWERQGLGKNSSASATSLRRLGLIDRTRGEEY